MTRFLRPAPSHGAKVVGATIAAAAGLAAAALVGVALAKTLTLQVAKNAKVTNQSGTTKSENIAINSRGFVIYTTITTTTIPPCLYPPCSRGRERTAGLDPPPVPALRSARSRRCAPCRAQTVTFPAYPAEQASLGEIHLLRGLAR
jgi:hypothetical protein